MPKLRVRDTPEELVRRIQVLAKDNGQTTTQFLKPVIRTIVEKYKNVECIKSEATKNMHIDGLSDTLTKEIESISKSLGVATSPIFKLELYLFIDGQSDFNKSLFLSET